MSSTTASPFSDDVCVAAETMESSSTRNDTTSPSRKENSCTSMERADASPKNQRWTCATVRNFFDCNHAKSACYVVAVALLVLQLWALLFCFVGSDAAPDGVLFRLLVLCAVGQVAGWLVDKISGVPPLVGMLMIGVGLRSTGYLVIEGPYIEVVASIRRMALAVLMTEAGLSIRVESLRRMSAHVLGLVLVPATGEVAAVAVLAYYIFAMPWIWGCLLGLVLCAVAPSVVMPTFLQLRAQGFGADKGIDALLLAAASIDDVLAVCIFGVVLGVIFSTGFSVMDFAAHPLGLLMGIIYGVFVGFVLQIVPSPKSEKVSIIRSTLLVGSGLVATFGSTLLGFAEFGPAACIIAGCVSGTLWRRRSNNLLAEETNSHVGILWAILQVPMFGLIGVDIDASLLAGDDVLRAAIVIVGALFVRGLCTFALMMTTSFSCKERFFVTLAWMPKADVQAALGPLALDLARQSPTLDLNAERYATDLLLVAVVSILLTAPAGAAVITIIGKRLLKPPSPPSTLAGRTTPSLPAENIANVFHIKADP